MHAGLTGPSAFKFFARGPGAQADVVLNFSFATLDPLQSLGRGQACNHDGSGVSWDPPQPERRPGDSEGLPGLHLRPQNGGTRSQLE